jgi:hypothetical protein
VSAFSDPEIIRMAREDYVSAVGDDWYQRRRDDPEGVFFRSVADQGPKKGEGGSTRQGVYCLTSAGKLLAYSNNAEPSKMRAAIRKGLAEWNLLPKSERRPGALRVDDSPGTDSRYSRRPPRHGLILNVYARILDHDAKGEVCTGSCKTVGGDRASRDHMWLTETEWKSLVPDHPIKGGEFTLPDAIADRLIRFHLVDNTRGEPPFWRNEDVRSRKLTLSIEDVSEGAMRLRLEGKVVLATNPDIRQADRGFDARLLGYLKFDRQRQTFDCINIVAIGGHWGEGTFTKGARPGRKPLGIAFEMSPGNAHTDQVPPQGAREIGEYLGHENR